MTLLLMTKQLNPDDRSRALFRGHYMNSLGDGSFSNHIKKGCAKSSLWSCGLHSCGSN